MGLVVTRPDILSHLSLTIHAGLGKIFNFIDSISLLKNLENWPSYSEI